MHVDPELIRRYDRPGPRYTSYPTAPNFSSGFDQRDHVAALERAGTRPNAALSLYVHLPFCRERCDFCGCNVVVAKDRARVDAYLDLLEREMELASAHLGGRRSVSQLHWGGGTPTFLDVPQLVRLFRMIEARFSLEPRAEIAIEIDPRVTSVAQLEALAGLGFNRASLGVQDVDTDVQEAIGRHQTVAQTELCVSTLRRLGFEGVNIDLIYGLPRQTSQTWAATLATVARLSPDRLAIYGFAFVPSVKPHQKRLPIVDLPDAPARLELIGTAMSQLTAAGYEPIGLDHFAKPTDELARAASSGRLSRNFQGYSVRPAPDTLALGASAISEIGGAFVQNSAALGRYRNAITAGKLATERGIQLSPDDLVRQRVIASIMCNLEVDLEQHGRWLPELTQLERFVEDGLVVLEGSRLRVTERGRWFLRNVAMVFDAHLAPATGPASFSRTV